MKQSILNHGDLVRYHIKNEDLDSMGFVLGQFYEVSKVLVGVLAIASPLDKVAALVIDDQLQDAADHFTKHRCPLTLPLGTLQKRLGQNG